MADAQIIPAALPERGAQGKGQSFAGGRRMPHGDGASGQLIEALRARNHDRDALHALCLILPHRQSVWWACLAARLMPDLARTLTSLPLSRRPSAGCRAPRPATPSRRACWPRPATTAAARIGSRRPLSGLALRSRRAASSPCRPAPYLPGVAVRAALLLFGLEPGLAGRVTPGDWMTMGLALMRG